MIVSGLGSHITKRRINLEAKTQVIESHCDDNQDVVYALTLQDCKPTELNGLV
jgi:hypothetical protein